MASKGFDGMRQLSEAEKGATGIVALARKDRQTRLASAKQEAASEIAAYEQRKEVEYQRLKQERLGDPETQYGALRGQTDAEIEAMKAQFVSNQQAVVDILLQAVTDVHVEVPAPWKFKHELTKSDTA